MGIGKMIPVVIKPYTSAKAAGGEWVETTGTDIQAWAEISNPSGFRAYMSGQTQLGETKDFLIRYRFDNTPGVNWRIVYDNRNWAVSEIRRIDEKKFYYRLTATSKGHD